MKLLGEIGMPVEKAQAWAKSRGATPGFVELAKLYWRFAPERGVRSDVAYSQAAKETGFGRFGGVIDATYHNPCGLKITEGGLNSDREAHQRFPTWEQGVVAHLDHLALYAGALGYPRKDTPDPRHFAFLVGLAPTVEDLSGHWAGAGYGESLRDDYIKTLRTFVYRPPVPPDYQAQIDELEGTVTTMLSRLNTYGNELVEDSERMDDLESFAVTTSTSLRRLINNLKDALA